LLTLKAARLLREADVVVFDRLIAPAILDLVPRGTARIYAGKTLGDHTLRQEEINDLLVRLARSHRRVVRLKGGDPFIFGRGSEEALHLAAHGIRFETVPGVTAAAGCAAHAGIPLTHRGLATSVRLVTGHCRADIPLDLNWTSLADPDATLVFYMGLANLSQIGRELIAAGLPPDTPAAAISGGTTPGEKICFAPLAELAARVRAAGLKAPVITVVGRVVQLAARLGRRAPVEHREVACA
jgi:uroporphyrin-III C-methyltransferase/precorrin-2 dehydrogenase/sirohydrochlorin ferrochelatase/uroporphyrin-III C-methyltransferase